jgi:transposase-like protein
VDHVTIHRWVQHFTPLLIDAARTFFTRALAAHGKPYEVITDLAQALETVIEELIPDAFHNTDQYADNRVECDHGQLKAENRRRLRRS